jgi:bifunctional oligoribonuclease and PAP phosphatase NrnA
MNYIKTLNIDHHFAHCPFGSLCLLDPAATSTCNIVYDLILAHAGNTHCITPEIATALLLGLIYDTNCYKNNNSRARDFRLTAELIECGGAYYPSIIEYYRRRPFHHFQMYGAVLAQMTTRANGRIIFWWATQELLQQYHIGENELGNMFINDFLTSIEGDIFLYITELVEGWYKMSLRSKTETYDVSQLAKQYFYGGGHKFSSGGTCELTKREIEDIVEQYWIHCQ